MGCPNSIDDPVIAQRHVLSIFKEQSTTMVRGFRHVGCYPQPTIDVLHTAFSPLELCIECKVANIVSPTPSLVHRILEFWPQRFHPVILVQRGIDNNRSVT